MGGLDGWGDSVKRFHVFPLSYRRFLKWWYPSTMGFPTKNDHFGVFWGYHHFRKPLIYWKQYQTWPFFQGWSLDLADHGLKRS